MTTARRPPIVGYYLTHPGRDRSWNDGYKVHKLPPLARWHFIPGRMPKLSKTFYESRGWTITPLIKAPSK